MRTEPTKFQRIATAIVGMIAATALGFWLMLSYFGVWTDDTKVTVEAPVLGDAMGPGAKVRYHGIIVGRVLTIDEATDGTYQVNLLIKKDHATAIPDTATARLLPGTVFGSEYVELLADSDATGDDHVASGDVLQVDQSVETLRLMESFDDADKLLSAIDVEAINEVTGKLAPALDGNGADIKAFLERANKTVTRVNEDLPTIWETLALTPPAVEVINDIEPDLIAAAEQSQKTLATVAERDAQLGDLLTSSTTVIDRGNTLVEKNREILLPFIDRLGRLTGLVADNKGNLQSILVEFARTGQNGAKGIDDNAIQMIGTIGTTLFDTYTAEDCTRYGDGFTASNCGGPLPEPEPEAEGGNPLGEILDRLQGVPAGDDATALPADQPDPQPTATSEPSQAPTAAAPASQPGLFDWLRNLQLGGAR